MAVFRYDKKRSDIKYVILTVYDIITRELELEEDYLGEAEEWDVNPFMEMPKWEKHRHAKLDRPVDEYRGTLAVWAKRMAGIDIRVDHWSKATFAGVIIQPDNRAAD